MVGGPSMEYRVGWTKNSASDRNLAITIELVKYYLLVLCSSVFCAASIELGSELQLQEIHRSNTRTKRCCSAHFVQICSTSFSKSLGANKKFSNTQKNVLTTRWWRSEVGTWNCKSSLGSRNSLNKVCSRLHVVLLLAAKRMNWWKFY